MSGSLTITDEDALRHQLHRFHHEWNDPGRIIKAMGIDQPGSLHSIDRVDLHMQSMPLLWLNAGQPVVNSLVFGDLTCVCIPRMVAGEVHHLGLLKRHEVEREEAKAIFQFLLRSGIVESYLHIGSELTFNVRMLPSGGWVFDVHGSHLYFTNERCEEPLHFQLKISPNEEIQLQSFI